MSDERMLTFKKTMIVLRFSFAFKVSTFVLALLSILFFSQMTIAQDLEAQKQELEELEHQLKILKLTRDLNIVTSSIRDHICPLDNVDSLIDEEYVGDMIRNALKLARELGSEMKSTPQWLKSTEEGIETAQQAAAAADLPIRMVRAISQRKTSRGSEKMADFAQILKDLNAVLPVLVTVNPVLGIYTSMMAKAVEGMVENVKVIEARKEKTNWAIDVVDEVLGQAEIAEETEDHPLDEAIDAAEGRIRELRNALDRPAYTDIKAARKRCYERQNITADEVYEMEQKVVKYKKQILEINKKIEDHERRVKVYEFRIKGLKKELADAEGKYNDLKSYVKPGDISEGEKLRRAKNKVDVIKDTIKIHSDELEKIRKGEYPEVYDHIPEREEADRKKLILEEKLDRFYACIRRQLRWAQYADEDYLEKQYPRYLPKKFDSFELSRWFGIWETTQGFIQIEPNMTITLLPRRSTNWTRYGFKIEMISATPDVIKGRYYSDKVGVRGVFKWELDKEDYEKNITYVRFFHGYSYEDNSDTHRKWDGKYPLKQHD